MSDVKPKGEINGTGMSCPHCGVQTNDSYKWHPALDCWNCGGVMWLDDYRRTIKQRYKQSKHGEIHDSAADRERAKRVLVPDIARPTEELESDNVLEGCTADDAVASSFSSNEDAAVDHLGMTAEEKRCHDALMGAMDLFIKMDRQHPDELRDFVDGVHRIQDVLAARVVRRCFPKGWPTHRCLTLTGSRDVRILVESLQFISKSSPSLEYKQECKELIERIESLGNKAAQP